MSKPWQLADWVKRRKEYIKGKVCAWCGSTEYLTIHHPQERNSIPAEKYNSFEGTIILCRRCHFATHKGMHLCPKCKKKYAKLGHRLCFSCYSKTKECKAERRERHAHMEDEVPIVNVTLPCGTTFSTYENQAEMGMVECCMHECPNKEIGGDVNNCPEWLKNPDL